MPQNARIQLKPKMTKKLRLPQDVSRKTSGRHYNEMNDKKKSGDDQRVLNNVSNTLGHTITSKGIKRPVGWLHTWGTLLAMAPPLDFPDQQMVLKRTPPAFEVNTRIDVRREGNQTRIHSFVSTSTLNHDRIQSPLFWSTPHIRSHSSSSIALPFASTSPLFGNQTLHNQTSTSTKQDIDIAKRAHELSVFVHQKVHDLYKLVNCTTTRRTDQVNTYIVAGESVEQTSFKTICQDAVGQAKRQNNQEMKQESVFSHPSPQALTNTTIQGTYPFSAKIAAQKLSKSFQSAYESKQNATGNDSNNVHNKVSETFWNDLTKRFYQFFYQHEQASSTQEQNGASNGSVMSYFVDWLLSTFSVNYGDQFPTNPQLEKNLKVPVRIQQTNHSLPTKPLQKKSRNEKQENPGLDIIPEVVSVLPVEEESFFSQFWHLAGSFSEMVDGFLQQWDGLKILGTEARPIGASLITFPVVLPVAFPRLNITVPNDPKLESDVSLANATMIKINNTMTDYLEGKNSTALTSELFPPFWFDLEVFKKRSNTEKVNEAINQFLRKRKVLQENLSGPSLILAVEKWEQETGIMVRIKRREELAKLILQKSNLRVPKLSLMRTTAILHQWRNNNIFKDYKFKEITQVQVAVTTNETTTVSSPLLITPPLHPLAPPSDFEWESYYGKITKADLTKANNIMMAFLNGLPCPVPTLERLMPMWYDFEVYEYRSETEKINKKIREFLKKQKITKKELSDLETVLSVQEWIKQGKEEAEVLNRREKIAHIILQEIGYDTEGLSNYLAEAGVYQWINNNAFKNFTFNEPEIAQVEKIDKDITNNFVPSTRYPEPLPNFYYDLVLYLKRNETLEVNKKMKGFFTKEGIKVNKTTGVKLEKAKQQWLEMGNNGTYDKLARKEYLVYFILNAYGVENVRLGETLSSRKIQAILMQWKINTFLEGYTYKQITLQTVYHQLSKSEGAEDIYYNRYKNEHKQIFADFINGRKPSIPQSKPIGLIYYNPLLFENRKKTPVVNQAIKKFLIDHKVPFKEESPREIVRGMQQWILGGETYAIIEAREKQVAELLQKEYGLEVKDVTVIKARHLLLQWENNNAQADYTYKEVSDMGIIKKSEIVMNEDRKEKVEIFLLSNSASRSSESLLKEGASDVEPTKSPGEQKEETLKKIIAFLLTKGINVDASKPNELVEKAAYWATMQVKGKVFVDFMKVKKLANLILGKKEDANISEEEAKETFMKWLYDTIEIETPTLTTTEPTIDEQTETTSTSPSVISERSEFKYHVPNWRDPNILDKVAQFFLQEGLLTGTSNKEKILTAMGKWFTKDNSEMVLQSEKLQPLTKVILKELKLYGGEEGEKISDKDAKLTLMKWVFENVLGSSVEVFMVKQILDSPEPSQFTIGSLRKLFEADKLRKSGLLTSRSINIAKEGDAIINNLWGLLLKEVLPNYFLEKGALTDELLISDYGLLMQLMGTKLLEDEGVRTHFEQTEIRMIGTFFLETVSKNSVKSPEALSYLLTPALLATAQLAPDVLRESLEKGNYKEVALQTFIGYWQNGYFKLMEDQVTLNDLYNLYQEEVLNWRRKGALASEEVEKCIALGAPSLNFALEELYLSGSQPCPTRYTAPILDDKYKKLTKAVSDKYYAFDQKLIELALKAFDPKELQFIFSSRTQLYKANAELEHTVYTAPSTSVKGYVPAAFRTRLKLTNTDLFVAVKGNEERWYALKKLEEDGGYVFYRVDKNPLLYLKYGLLDHSEIWGQGYKKVGNGIQIDDRYFNFFTHQQQSMKNSQGMEMQELIDLFSQKHSDALYDELYKSGNDKSYSEQAWDFIKHLIPFYDCITGIANQDASQAVPSCVIDAVLLIPIIGQITALNTRFALGLARAIATGGVKNAIYQGARFTPKVVEVKAVLKSILRYLDPGIELASSGGKFVVKELIYLRNEFWVRREVRQTLQKLADFVKETPSLPKDVVLAKLPGDGPEIAVKKMPDHLYRHVTNLATGTVYGVPFMLKSKRLERFVEPASFTEEQVALIDRLSVKLDESQVTVIEPNVNPAAYGEGEIITVKKEGEEAKYYIKMKDHTIPVRITAIDEQGVRYDVCEGENVFPVSYNGKEWFFEPATSPYVSKVLEEEINKMIDKFESTKDPSVLSGSREKGLMWNASGRSYIKINNHYIPLILLHKNGDRYHLVKKDALQPITVLIFDSENEQFRFETALEKERWKEASVSEEATSKEGEPGSSQGATSQGATIQGNEKLDLPPYNTVPEAPGRGEEWNEFRQAINFGSAEDKSVIKRVEDDSVSLDPITAFLPIAKPVVFNDPKWAKEAILKVIFRTLPKKPDPVFRVYGGIKSENVPEYIDLFRKDLLKEFPKAQSHFQKTLELCQELLTKEKIADSPQGQYLIKMFRLDNAPNQEVILKEAVNRLLDSSKKGKQFLQKTADWDYENILMTSTDLIQESGPQKYRSKYDSGIHALAIVTDYDPECRINFFVDAFYLKPNYDPGRELKTPKSEVLLHETSHIVSDTQDLMTYKRAMLFKIKSGQEMLEDYDKKYGTIFESTGFQAFVDQLAWHQNKVELSKRTVREEIARNDLLRVNLQIIDAEMLMTIIRDFAEERDFEGKLRVARSLNDVKLGDGLIAVLSTLHYITKLDSFESIQLEQTQEQTADILDQTSVISNGSTTQSSEGREKREVVERSTNFGDSQSIELTNNITQKSFFNLVDQGKKICEVLNESRRNQQSSKNLQSFTMLIK
ncbi:hypothetical protein E1H99_00935 [Enterococcus hirae]|nr:hypothetical protein E1H99_00935 [Enterococcus hirae]